MFLHVVASFQTSSEKESLYWMVYLEMGLWLSAPRLHCNVTLLSVLSITCTPPGAPGGPGGEKNKRQDSVVRWVKNTNVAALSLSLKVTQVPTSAKQIVNLLCAHKI